jgi:hypothetical protein
MLRHAQARLRSHAEAAGIALVQNPNAVAGTAPPSGLDAELFALTKTLGQPGQAETAIEAVRALVDRGASVTGSNALHCCAANGASMAGLIPGLLRLGGDINGRDFQGSTPLIMAASKAAWATVDAPENMTPEALAGATATIEVLLANGADRALADGDGLTALGVMRRTVRATNDFRAAMLEQQRRPPHPALEASAAGQRAAPPRGRPTRRSAARNTTAGSGSDEGALVRRKRRLPRPCALW